MAVYYFALTGLFIYGLHRIWLLFCVYRVRKSGTILSDGSAPFDKDKYITVQLPVYNERFVAARLIDSVARFDWHPDRLDIQVLDDSTDDTTEIIDSRVAYWSKRGISIKVLRRNNRRGFKAGALAEGLKHAKGEFIAVFDADFIPPPDFLIRTMPCFSDPATGMVQGRWGFVNSGHNWFTRIQALLLSPHFEIEHNIRFKRGLFFNFNGTAGIWRREAIESSGGWQSDTVTEDLDLSYRAQLNGWRFIYLNDLVVPSELPVTLDAFRGQQQRWAKGSIQSARKILPALLFSQSYSIEKKIESVFHLLANMGWLLGTVITLTLYPVIYFRVDTGPYQLLRLDLPLLLGSSGTIMLYFLYYAISHKEQRLFKGLILLPIMTIGMAPSIALSVLAGAFKKGGFFNRTPKSGCGEKETLPLSVYGYYNKNISFIILNLFFLTYTIFPFIFSAHRGTWIAVPFLAIFPLGFILVVSKELREIKQASKMRIKSAAKTFRPVQTLSVVIPCLNESKNISAALESVRDEKRPIQVIIADGGSRDSTIEKVSRFGAIIVESGKGRGIQINAGLHECTGDAVLILHADCRIIPGTIDRIFHALNSDFTCLGGSLGMTYATGSFKYRLLSMINNARSLYGGVSFGDQGQFFRSEALDIIGGFPQQMLMEDIEFSLRLKNKGKVAYIPGGIVASVRRWEEKGFMKNFAHVIVLFLMYLVRRRFFSPDTLKNDFYYSYYKKDNTSL